MNDPIYVIKKIKEAMEEVILEDNISSVKGFSIEDIFLVYNADFSGILIGFFPGATVMMNKTYRSCATMINGKVYDATGLRKDACNFHVADEEEIGYIQKSFNQMSSPVMDKLTSKLWNDLDSISKAYTLRKNRDVYF